MHRTASTLAGTILLAALLTSCADDVVDVRTPGNAAATGATPSGVSGTPAPSSSAAPSDDGPPFPDDTASQTADPRGEWDLVLTDVRVGRHDGYDRLVMEFAGTGTPGWSLGYVERPVLDGSGDPVALGGDAYLDVHASVTTYPGEGAGYAGPRQLRPEGGGRLVDVHVGGTFEGYTQVLAGIAGEPVPFRAFALSDPPRLVVDLLDSQG